MNEFYVGIYDSVKNYNFSEADRYCADHYGTEIGSINMSNIIQQDAAVNVRANSSDDSWVVANESGNRTSGNYCIVLSGNNHNISYTHNYNYNYNTTSCNSKLNQFICTNPKYSSCADWMYNFRYIKQLPDGVYYIYNQSLGVLEVYCRFDYENNYGWTLIQSASKVFLISKDFSKNAFIDDAPCNSGMFLFDSIM